MQATRYILTIVLYGCLAIHAQSQGFSIPFCAADNGNRFDTLRFGVHVNATYCIDTALGERELPRCSLVGLFCASFADIRYGMGACHGNGLRLDLRPHIDTTQIDTYRVVFQPSEAGYPFTFSWPDLNSFYRDSVQLMDIFGGIIIKVNMKTQTSYTLNNTAFSSILIIAKSPNLVTGAAESEIVPVVSHLQQNYPNPFNPFTDLRFVIGDLSHVTLKVFDVLGREVATLVNEKKYPGEYTVSWDASAKPSGVYIYRLQAEKFVAVKKMLVIK